MARLDIHLVPCLQDNYAYLIHDRDADVTGVVDPSEAEPVFAALEQQGWRLTHILNTHHHWDHTGGNLALKEATGAQIVGPKADYERIPGIEVALGEGDEWTFGTQTARIFDIPGHTRGHIAFWFPDSHAVFTGDTLFALGCGRLFEGTPEQMWSSLSKLRALPPLTAVYCGHEYTQANARFALTVEPENVALVERARRIDDLRALGRPTIPSTIGEEIETNPFLRPGSSDLRRHVGLPQGGPIAVFAETRRLKDSF